MTVLSEFQHIAEHVEVASSNRSVSCVGTRCQQRHGVVNDMIDAFSNIASQTSDQRMAQTANARARLRLIFTPGSVVNTTSDLGFPSLDVLLEAFFCDGRIGSRSNRAHEVSCSVPWRHVVSCISA